MHFHIDGAEEVLFDHIVCEDKRTLIIPCLYVAAETVKIVVLSGVQVIKKLKCRSIILTILLYDLLQNIKY